MLHTRRDFLKAAAVASAAAWPVTSARAASVDLSKVRLRLATYKGGDRTWLKLAGLDQTPYTIDWVEMSGGNLMVEAMNAGALDLASGSEIPPIFASVAQQANIRVVAVLKDDVAHQVILVPKGSSIKTIAELKGKRVGYVRATTTHYYLLRMLADAGLGFDDIKAVNLSPSDGYAAFNSGELDAWAIYGYNVPLAQGKTGARVLKTAVGYLSGNYLYYAAPAALADAGKRAAMADWFRRLQRACLWFESHRPEFARAFANEIHAPLEPVLELYSRPSQPRRIVPVDEAAIQSQQKVADTFTQAKLLPRRLAVAGLWDTTFHSVLSRPL